MGRPGSRAACGNASSLGCFCCRIFCAFCEQREPLVCLTNGAAICFFWENWTVFLGEQMSKQLKVTRIVGVKDDRHLCEALRSPSGWRYIIRGRRFVCRSQRAVRELMLTHGATVVQVTYSAS
jgi:hypothetical protein